MLAFVFVIVLTNEAVATWLPVAVEAGVLAVMTPWNAGESNGALFKPNWSKPSYTVPFKYAMSSADRLDNFACMVDTEDAKYAVSVSKSYTL